MLQIEHIPSIRLRAIEVTGPDAISFAQSQLTLDLDSIADSRLHPTAWCSPDGRVEAVMLVTVKDDRVWLVLPDVLAASALKRARLFSIGRNVALKDDVAAYPSVGSRGEAQRTVELALDPGRALLLGNCDMNPERQDDRLSDPWLQADIECAMPWILPETARAYLPQMLGLETLGGLSYKKGCFPGQEVIARVHYRGRVTRRTSRFRLAADSPPEPGTEFDLAGKPAQVLYAIADPAGPGGALGLAVVASEAEVNAEIDIGPSTGTLL